MLQESSIIEALKSVYDPEIPLNIVDLGLIYSVDINEDEVSIQMTLTAVGCPMANYISDSAKQAIMNVEGVDSVNISIIWEPRWTPERISTDGRKSLGMV